VDTIELTPAQKTEVLEIIQNAKAEAEVLIGPAELKDPAVVAQAEAFVERATMLAALFA
jgi:hypothetical protein